MKNLLTNMRMLSGLYPETYFAGANTKRGFVSAYPAFIDETVLTRVYVLKGGSGTGKSSLMKKCAERAVANGSSVTMLLCSSDPSSADAVILKGEHGAAAILDGTAPHITDPLFPGAVSEIVNLGEFWRPDALRNARCEITAHGEGKRAAYGRAYRYLSAYGEITKAAEALLSDCILKEKMYAAATRVLSSVPKGKTYGEMLRHTAAISMEGMYRLSTFSAKAKKKYAVVDSYGCGSFFLDALRSAAAERRCMLWYAPAPCETETPYELYFPTSEISFSLVGERDFSADGSSCEPGEHSVVNMGRFLDRRSLSSCRARLRFSARCREMLLDGALESLADARLHHFRLEEIYKSAMDFDGVSETGERIENEISKILCP